MEMDISSLVLSFWAALYPYHWRETSRKAQITNFCWVIFKRKCWSHKNFCWFVLQTRASLGQRSSIERHTALNCRAGIARLLVITKIQFGNDKKQEARKWKIFLQVSRTTDWHVISVHSLSWLTIHFLPIMIHMIIRRLAYMIRLCSVYERT